MIKCCNTYSDCNVNFPAISDHFAVINEKDVEIMSSTLQALSSLSHDENEQLYNTRLGLVILNRESLRVACKHRSNESVLVKEYKYGLSRRQLRMVVFPTALQHKYHQIKSYSFRIPPRPPFFQFYSKIPTGKSSTMSTSTVPSLGNFTINVTQNLHGLPGQAQITRVGGTSFHMEVHGTWL